MLKDRALLSNILNTFPTNSSKNKIKLNGYTYCLEEDGIICRRVHKPSGLQLPKSVLLLVLPVDIRLLQQDVG